MQVDAERQRTGDRARQLLLRSLAAQTAQRANPRKSGQPDIFLFNIVRWEALTQRPHHFARGLAERGYRVFWIDVSLVAPGKFLQAGSPRRLADNLYHFQLPGLDGDVYHLLWNDAVLELMTAAMGHLQRAECVERAVQIVNFPGWTPLVERLRERFHWPIVYDCLDDQRAFGELYGQQATAAYEERLTGLCDLLVTSGRTLYEMKRHREAILIPNAADYSVFNGAVSRGLLSHLPRPVIGFFGAFADWLDVDWVAESARRFPAYSFVYIGSNGFARPENEALWMAATSAPNVHLFARAELPQLAAYLVQFDVCTMPFQDLPITRSMHAVKIYEYLAAGKHVLTPALPEMHQFAAEGLICTYENPERSFELLETLALRRPHATAGGPHARRSPRATRGTIGSSNSRTQSRVCCRLAESAWPCRSASLPCIPLPDGRGSDRISIGLGAMPVSMTHCLTTVQNLRHKVESDLVVWLFH